MDAELAAALGAVGRAAWQVLAGVVAEDGRCWECTTPGCSFRSAWPTTSRSGTRPMRPVAIVGPTATGKSALAIELARRLGGEVVNADAMQLYRGMDIGTAKVTDERTQGRAAPPARRPRRHRDRVGRRLPADARAVIEGLLAAGRVPILVGGSGLYVQAVLDELDFPGTDPGMRARLEHELASRRRRRAACPAGQRRPGRRAAILPSNGRRIVRALEVIELTGRPFSANMPRPGPARYDTVLIGLDLDSDRPRRAGRRRG